jgi:hypothetical protein
MKCSECRASHLGVPRMLQNLKNIFEYWQPYLYVLNSFILSEISLIVLLYDYMNTYYEGNYTSL